jgi:putative sigma-54 modulation protein
MQLNITGHHVDVTNALRNYVTGKFDRIDRHDTQITNVHVILTVEKLEQKAEATIHTSGADMFADATEGDMYAAIDALVDKLDRQIMKHKGKQAGRKQRVRDQELRSQSAV